MSTLDAIAKAKTFDGTGILFYSDGLVTTSLGYGFGAGTGRAKKTASIKQAVKANQLVAGEISLFDFSEVDLLIRVARDYVKTCGVQSRDPLPGEYRLLIARGLEKKRLENKHDHAI